MVELFTAAGFARGPRTWSRSGSGCHQPGGSPRRRTLSGPAFAGRPEPRGRICGLAPAHRLCDMTALILSYQGLSASPPFCHCRRQRQPGSNTLSDRTLRLDAGKQSQRVYFSEPPSSTDKRLSPHPALPAQHAMAGETIPLAWLVARFTGYAAQSRGRTRQVSATDDHRTVFCTQESISDRLLSHATACSLALATEDFSEVLVQDDLSVVGGDLDIASRRRPLVSLDRQTPGVHHRLRLQLFPFGRRKPRQVLQCRL